MKPLQVPDAIFRVLIVDRYSMSSDLLANALAREGSFEAVAGSPGNILSTLASGRIDMLVIGTDVDSKPGSGFQLAQAVNRTHPETVIVMLLNQSTRESVIKAFRSGARGVFSRQQPVTEFLDCVRHLRRGFIWAGREETDSLLEAVKSFPVTSLTTSMDSSALTTRELQVVQCAAKGMKNRVIASELGLSEHTVKNYLFRTFEKLGVSSRVELLLYLTIRGYALGTPKVTAINTELAKLD